MSRRKEYPHGDYAIYSLSVPALPTLAALNKRSKTNIEHFVNIIALCVKFFKQLFRFFSSLFLRKYSEGIVHYSKRPRNRSFGGYI